MSDLLALGSDWLECQRKKFLSKTVTYTRGTDSVDLAATIGKTVFEVEKGFGLMERTEARDYLVTTSDLRLADAAASPRAGDRISETQGSLTFIYEVMAPANEPVWRYSDPGRKTLRIHTKLVATE